MTNKIDLLQEELTTAKINVAVLSEAKREEEADKYPEWSRK